MIHSVIHLSEVLLALAIFFQTIELFQMKAVWSEKGIWRWSTLREDYLKYPRLFVWFLDLLLNEKQFSFLLLMRLLACIAVAVMPNQYDLGILFFSTWLISIRWRGVFNGGSDSMTAVVSLGLFLAEIFAGYEWLQKGCLAYIAVQLTASYFIAGWVKLKNSDWRSGAALPVFIETPRYDSPVGWVKAVLSQPRFSFAASWAVILFECAFPLAWTNSNLCLAFLAGAFVFHIFNFWTFGLNRFVFAWLAGYPALFYWSHRLM